MRKFLEILSVSVFGGMLYGAIEVIYRGYTHWTMLITGAVCTALMYIIAVKSREKLWKKWIMCGFCITTVEFVVGIIVNIVMKMDVWDYTDNAFNLMGQICLLFSVYWTGISIPAVWMCQQINKRFRMIERAA